jgi:hypothetical protein
MLVGCSDRPSPTEVARAAVPPAVLASRGSAHGGAIVAHDSCDPATFNEELGPGTCVKPGRTTVAEFIAELTASQIVRSWRFNPLTATAREGVDMLAINVGGEEHTFTPVREFGGGFIPFLNQLSGTPVPAPECLNVPALDFVGAGEKSIIPAADLAAVASGGIARVECCIHPWMRAEVRLK